MPTPATLPDLLARRELVLAPGAYDALTAKLIAGVGFPAVYMTGYGTAAAHGYPDVGLLSMTEMVDTARTIAAAVDVPVIADADTGYGNPVNVTRTVREYERAGVAAIHLEDQVWPKRCGHMSGKQVIPAADMCAKLRAAADARASADFLLIARTDAIAVEGWDAAIERAHAYADAGADVLFVEAPTTVEQVEAIPGLFAKPCLLNIAPRTPVLAPARLRELGYAIVIYPGLCLMSTIQAVMGALQGLKDDGRLPRLEDALASFAEFNAFLGVGEYADLESRYGS